MIRVFTLDVLISCIIAAFILGGLIGFTIMWCLIAGKDSEGEHDEPDTKRK